MARNIDVLAHRQLAARPVEHAPGRRSTSARPAGPTAKGVVRLTAAARSRSARSYSAVGRGGTIALGLRGPADAIGKAIARRMPPASSCMTTAQPGRTSSPPRPARRLLAWQRHPRPAAVGTIALPQCDRRAGGAVRAGAPLSLGGRSSHADRDPNARLHPIPAVGRRVRLLLLGVGGRRARLMRVFGADLALKSEQAAGRLDSDRGLAHRDPAANATDRLLALDARAPHGPRRWRLNRRRRSCAACAGLARSSRRWRPPAPTR